MSLRSRTISIIVAANLALIAVAIFHGLHRTGDATRYFGEGRYTMAGSCLQLLLVAGFSFGIGARRRRISADRRWNAGHLLWVLIGLGFIFLACDEAFQFHERMDQWVHHTLRHKANAWSDRLDDAIIGAYACTGLAVLWLFRREVMRFRVFLLPLFIGAFFTGLEIFCDMATNRKDFVTMIFHEHRLAERWYTSLTVAEGAFTLLAEGMFVAAFFLGWREASHLPEPAAEASGEAAGGLA